MIMLQNADGGQSTNFRSALNSLLLPCPRDQILFISYGGKYLYPLSPKLHLFHADLEAFQQAKLTICQPARRMP